MSRDQMQTSRFELKYVISEDTAREIRAYVQSFLERDEHGVDKPDYSYPVHSLYLDSDEMKTYWDTINGNRNRFKLRVRFYSDHPDTPVFCEIKQRLNSCIVKQRGGVRREALPSFLAGQLPPLEALVSQQPKQLVALQNFSRRMQEIQARPKVHVAYQREAYVPLMDNQVRLTMDRQVRAEPTSADQVSTQMRNPILVWGQAVVLELKFTNHYPNWFGDLVRAFDLKQCGAAKYADGVTLMSGHLPQHRNMPRPNPDLRWPVDNDYSQTHMIDHEETPSSQSVASAMRR